MTELLLVGYLFATNQPLTIVSPDGQLYMNLATNLLNGEGLINTVRMEDIIVPPLFPLLLVPFLGLFKTITAFFVFQYVLYGLNAVILFHLTVKIFNQKSISWIATFLYIVHPVLLLNGPNYLLTETVFTFFVLIITWSILSLMDSIQKKDGINKAFISSILIICISMLLRPHMLYVLPLMYIAALFLVYKRLLTKKGFALSILIPIVLFGSNMLHNYLVHQEAVPFENYSGQNLYIANNPNTNIEFYNTHKLKDFVEPYFFTLSDLSLSEKGQVLKDRVIDYMLSEPLVTMERLISRALLFFQGINTLDTIMTLLFIIGALLAFIHLREKRGVTLVLLYLILGFTALSSTGLLVDGQRYRAPIIPIYLTFSAYCIYAFIVFLKGLIQSNRRV